MSFRDATRPQDLGPDRLKPAEGAPILDPSVEAEGRTTDLCTAPAPRDVNRARLLIWLAEGPREVTWALCSLAPEHWASAPPRGLGDWAALRHIRHLALRQAHALLPTVCQAVGDPATAWSAVELEHADADALNARSAEDIIREFGETRFELHQRVESAPDEVWDQLERPLLQARQHELHHLAVVWNLALNWERVARAPTPGVPLHPADRLEESH